MLGRRSRLGAFAIIVAAGLLVSASGCASHESATKAQTLPEYESSNIKSYLAAATSVRYDSETVLAMGQQVCYDIGHDGLVAARNGLDTSSRTPAERSTMWNAARGNLCPDA